MNGHLLNLQGQQHVTAELLKRGAVSVTAISCGTRRTYLQVVSPNVQHTTLLRVKTKQKGRWHTTIDEARPVSVPSSSTNVKNYWVLVDFSGCPRYWIVPDDWLHLDIDQAHQQYLQNHQGHRAQNDASNHHAIEESRLTQWQDKWELLGLC